MTPCISTSRRMLWLASLTTAASVIALLPGRSPGFGNDRFFPGIGAYTASWVT